MQDLVGNGNHRTSIFFKGLAILTTLSYLETAGPIMNGATLGLPYKPSLFTNA
jgi:hypothetical protein